MTGKQWIKSFIESLFEQRTEANDKKYDNNSTLWTEFMVKTVMKEIMSKKIDCRVTCRDKDDRENSGEYLNIDAMFFNESDYHAPGYLKMEDNTLYDPRFLPVAVVEHENEGSKKSKIAHCLWKLLCIRSSLRVLVCYHKDIEGIRELLENTIRDGKLTEGLTDGLVVIIGDSSKDDVPWEKRDDIRNYFKIFEWENNHLKKFTE